jgi:hypothetical protein
MVAWSPSLESETGVGSTMTLRRLSPSDEALLREVVAKHDPTLLSLIDYLGITEITEEEREKLRGLLASELCETGLAENDEPNQRGLLMDDLIDILGRM